MFRTVAAHLDATVTAPAELVLAVAVARHPGLVAEDLSVTLDGRPLGVREITSGHGGRLHVVSDVAAGRLDVDYRARVEGRADPEPVSELDLITYRNPSRYADSDRMLAVALAHFSGLSGVDLVNAVTSWVGTHLVYVPGSSRPLDGAVDSYLARAGVCRDFAHLVVAFLRAVGLPARLAAVYAPGLAPMDFHAVAEVFVDGGWHVTDATTLAPRGSMLRIATGRDAADTAFLNVFGGRVQLGGMEVSAVVEPELPGDDVTGLVRLG